MCTKLFFKHYYEVTQKHKFMQDIYLEQEKVLRKIVK